MAGKNAGQRLSQDEVAEYLAYRNREAAPPAKYDGVVFDNATPGSEAFYRFATPEEERAGQEAAKAEAEARASAEKMNAKIDAELAKRGASAEPAVPAQPAG